MAANDLQSIQRAKTLDLFSEGPVAGLCDANGNILSYADREKGILLDLTAIKNTDGTTAIANVSTDIRLGHANQTAMAGFSAAEEVVPVNTEVKNAFNAIANAVQRQIPAGPYTAVKVSIIMPSFYSYDEDGNMNGASVQLRMQLKLSSSSTWSEVVNTTIQGTSPSQYPRDFRIGLVGDGPWDLRVIRDTLDSTDEAKLQNKTWWGSYTLMTEKRLTYRHCAIAGVEQSSEGSSAILPRAFRLKGLLVKVPSNYNPATRKYTGTWDGNFAGCAITLATAYTAFGTTVIVSALTKKLPNNSPIKITDGTVVSEAYLDGDHNVGATTLKITPIPRNIASGASGWGYILKWTNNPAWIWYDLATNKRYGLGNYIPDDSVDRWSLYSIARYCDAVDDLGNFVGVDDGKGGVEPRFTCTVCIQTQQDAFRLLSDIASVFRGMLFWSSSSIAAVQDSPKSATFNFTNADVVGGEFVYSSSARKSRHTIARVTWNDPDDYYKPKIIDVDGDPTDIDRWGYRPISVNAVGCTSKGQAQRVGKWILLTEKYETETVSFRGGLKAARCRPGMIINVRDRNKTQNRMGGRIKAVGSTTLDLDAPVVISGSGNSILVTKTDGTIVELPVTNSGGTYQTLTVTGSLDGIVANTDWILRRTNLEPTKWRVLNVKEVQKHQFEVIALQYEEDKFAAVEDGTPVHPARTSDLPPVVIPDAPASITISESTVNAGEGVTRRLNIGWSKATSKNVKGYMVEIRTPGKEWSTAALLTKALTLPPMTVSALGLYEVRVTTIGYYNLKSTSAEGSYLLGAVQAPDTPADFAVVGVAGGFKLSWTDSLLDGYYEIYMSATTTRPASTSLRVPSGQSEFTTTGFIVGTTRYFWLRAVKNRVGLTSGYTLVQSGTALDTKGDQGIPGPPGSDGQTSYFHIAYADSADGATNFNQTAGKYVGTYVDFNPTDSSDYHAYTWRQFKGTDGIPGTNGSNGQTSYLHIKYSNDGGSTFTASSGETPGDWIGTYVDFTAADSSSVSAYTWKKIKGDQGSPGIDGLNSATVYIFKRASSAPALPSASCTYTFATKALTGLNNGWSATVPDTDGHPLYVSAASPTGTGATDTIAPSEWASPTIMAKDGDPGSNGADGLNSSTVFLFKRTTTSTPPSLPSTNTTYTFATGVASGMNNGWTQSMPTSGGAYRWMTTGSALSAGATDTIAPGEWAAVTLIAQDGSDGANGSSVLGVVAGGGSAASTSYVNISPALSLTVTCDGQARTIRMQSGYVANASGATTACYVALYRDSTKIAELGNGNGVTLGAGQNIPTEFSIVDTPSAGSHTFSIRVKSAAGSSVATGGSISVS